MVKSLPAVEDTPGSIPGLERSPREGNGYLPVSLSGEFHGQRSLVGHHLWACQESVLGLQRMGITKNHA